MAYTDESWFLYFHANQGNPRGSKDKATIQTTNGIPIMHLEPDAGFASQRNRSYRDAIAASFEDNVRLAGAAREMYNSLKDIYQAAMRLNLPPDHPMQVSINNAMAALVKANPMRYQVTYDDVVKFTGTNDECFVYVQQSQGQSVDYATQYGGWKIEIKNAREIKEEVDEFRTESDEVKGPGL